MWSILALVGGAIGAWWLLSSKSDSRPKPPPPAKGGSGIDTVSHGDGKFPPMKATVVAHTIDRNILKQGHYHPGDYNWYDLVINDSDSVMAFEGFENWNDAWEYYKLLKDFYDTYYTEWTCPPSSIGIVLFMVHESDSKDSGPILSTWWKCDEP